MTEKRHGQSKEKYSVILLDILPNSIQIAISKDFAEDLTSKTSVLTGYTTRSKLRKIIRWQIALCYFKCLREPFTMICTELQLPTEQFFYFLTFHFCFQFQFVPLSASSMASSHCGPIQGIVWHQSTIVEKKLALVTVRL